MLEALNTINCFEVPIDKTFSPFLFPIQYALAMKAHNERSPISDQQITNDLTLISQEIQRPIVVLFDESNVLAKSRVLLEKLRNIFRNIQGYMLVLTGTVDLFPIMDDVFSPIVRQFKKITVKEFTDKSDTAECIRRPLQKYGIPLDVSDMEVDEIHELSGGKPYEIQLICHLLFRRIQAQRTSRLRLDLGVLEEIRRELERSQDISSRPVLTAVKGLDPMQFRALAALTVCDDRISFDELWSLHYVFEGTGEFTKNRLSQEFAVLKRKGILVEEDDRVKFAGDYFDKLFTKYCAAEQKVRVNIRPLSLEAALTLGVLRFVRPLTDFSVFGRLDSWSDVENVVRELSNSFSEQDVFGTSPAIVGELYLAMVDFRKKGVVPALFVSLSVAGAKTAALIIPRSLTKEGEVEKVKRNLMTVKSRVANLGGALLTDRRDFPVAPVELLSKKLLRSKNETLRKDLAKRHVKKLVSSYLAGDMEEASLHASLALGYDPVAGEPSQVINLGYYYLVTENYELAQKLLQHAIDISSEDPQRRALASYDLAIVRMQAGLHSKALELFAGCCDLLRQVPAGKDMKCARLRLLGMQDGHLTFTEVSDCDLLRAGEGAVALLKTLIVQ